MEKLCDDSKTYENKLFQKKICLKVFYYLYHAKKLSYILLVFYKPKNKTGMPKYLRRNKI